MKNQRFKAQRAKYEVPPNFGICCRESGGGGSKVQVFAHASAVSASSLYAYLTSFLAHKELESLAKSTKSCILNH